MIEIQVAGAGAGKTYGLAKRIAENIKNESSTKMIFAITYTNTARTKIERQLDELLGFLPDRLRVETVHSFLLNYIIYPFSPFVTGTVYSSTTTASLPTDIRYKQKYKRELKERGVLHAEDAYVAARRIVDCDMSMHNTKAKKVRVSRALKILACAIDRIYVDEVQDFDKVAFRIFEIIGKSVISMYMVGDPKQAIKYSNEFVSFISKFESKSDPLVCLLPPENITRRVPAEILSISNKFCFRGQEQTSLSSVKGILNYVESTSRNYKILIESTINSGGLVCIDKATEGYSTHGANYSLPTPACDLIRKSCNHFDPELYLKAANLRFYRDVERVGNKRAVGRFFEGHKIKYDKKIYAALMQSTSKSTSKNSILVRSIDSVKGLEADVCILVITPNTYKYLMQKTLKPEQRHNKEWNKLYVALTRTKKQFVVAIDHNLFLKQKYKTDNIRKNLEEIGFTPYKNII